MNDPMTEQLGLQLGSVAFQRETDFAQILCEHEKRRINAANEPEITFLRARLLVLNELRKELVAARRACCTVRSSANGGRGWHLFVAIALTIAGFAFTMIALETFRLGWKGVLYSAALALVAPFCIDFFLDQWQHHPSIVRVASVVALAAIIPTVLLLGAIRGEILAHSLQSDSPPLVLDDDKPAPVNFGFVDRITRRLQLALLLAALATELAGGLALHRFRSIPVNHQAHDLERIHRDISEVETQMTAAIRRTRELQIESASFEATYWRNFYIGFLLKASRPTGIKLLSVIFSAVLFAHISVAAERPHTDFVIGHDLSQTEAVRGSDGTPEVKKNALAIAKALSYVPSGSHLRILGIGERSFAAPNLLLSARIDPDAGYFGERLARARHDLVELWHKRSDSLMPSSFQTDILGVLAYVAETLGPASATKILLFSDMRNETEQLNLQIAKRIDVRKALAKLERQHLSRP
jgi:hypothetical protein